MLLAEGLRVADREEFQYSYVHFLPENEEVIPLLQAQGAPVTCLGSGSNLSMLLSSLSLARYLQRVQADVVHAHLPVAGVIARVAGRLARVPVVYSEHSVVDKYHPVTRTASRLSWRMQREAIAVSPDVADSIRRNFGPRVDVKVVLNGIDMSKFKREGAELGERVRSEWGIPQSAPVVGTVARFRPSKRLDLWLEAAELIRAEVPDVHFLMVGDGEVRDNLERQVGTAGLSDVVHFAGLQDTVQPFLAAMDVFLMSSEYEGFGLAPVEAMAMGVPVVATEVSGVRNVIDHGKTGLLVPYNADVVAEMARSVGALLTDTELRATLRTGGLEAAASRFSISRMQKELEHIYRSVSATT